MDDETKAKVESVVTFARDKCELTPNQLSQLQSLLVRFKDPPVSKPKRKAVSYLLDQKDR